MSDQGDSNRKLLEAYIYVWHVLAISVFKIRDISQNTFGLLSRWIPFPLGPYMFLSKTLIIEGRPERKTKVESLSLDPFISIRWLNSGFQCHSSLANNFLLVFFFLLFLLLEGENRPRPKTVPFPFLSLAVHRNEEKPTSGKSNFSSIDFSILW